MGKNYRINEEALADLERIYIYSFQRYGVAQADTYYNLLFDPFEKIAEQPDLYPALKASPLLYTQCLFAGLLSGLVVLYYGYSGTLIILRWPLWATYI